MIRRLHQLLVLGLPTAALLALPVSARYVTTQEERPTANGLIEQGWTLLPPYDGEHRPFLTEEAQKDTAAAAHLFAAGVALDDSILRGLWSLGHAHILLGEDRRNRGDAALATKHYDQAIDALTRALELDPEDPWSAYARGISYAMQERFDLALADLDRAVAKLDAQIAASGDGGSLAWLRFKALEWRPEVLMRAQRHEEARETLRTFHAEFSNNEWPMHIALAVSQLRERNFTGARAAYDDAIARFPSDHQAYAFKAYVEGLLGNKEEATVLMAEALQRELQADMYTRLWLWVLATDEARPEAEADLKGFLGRPPSRIGEWDLRLGRFALGPESPDSFLAEAHAERDRRLAAAQPLDDLMCEVWFYIGLRHENEAAQAADDRERSTHERAALDAHAKALSFSPERWKWEWAFARLHFADLAAKLTLGTSFDVAVEGETVRVGELAGVGEDLRWHRPRQPQASASLEGGPRPGDLFLGRIRTDEGTSVPVRSLVGVR